MWWERTGRRLRKGSREWEWPFTTVSRVHLFSMSRTRERNTALLGYVCPAGESALLIKKQ